MLLPGVSLQLIVITAMPWRLQAEVHPEADGNSGSVRHTPGARQWQDVLFASGLLN
jgi:hypothetical protein